MMLIPAHRISHADDCFTHKGFRCSCDRPVLLLTTRLIFWLCVSAMISLLALTAAVLK